MLDSLSPRDLEGLVYFCPSPRRFVFSSLAKGFVLEEHLTQVGGPGAPLDTDLVKFQSQVSPVHHPQEVAEATHSYLVRLVLN